MISKKALIACALFAGVHLGGVVVCKAARLDQNKKYDLPTLGPQTLKSFKKGDIAAIAWQSSQTFIASKDEFVAKAEKREIVLVSV